MTHPEAVQIRNQVADLYGPMVTSKATQVALASAIQALDFVIARAFPNAGAELDGEIFEAIEPETNPPEPA